MAVVIAFPQRRAGVEPDCECSAPFVQHFLELLGRRVDQTRAGVWPFDAAPQRRAARQHTVCGRRPGSRLPVEEGGRHYFEQFRKLDDLLSRAPDGTSFDAADIYRGDAEGFRDLLWCQAALLPVGSDTVSDMLINFDVHEPGPFDNRTKVAAR